MSRCHARWHECSWDTRFEPSRRSDGPAPIAQGAPGELLRRAAVAGFDALVTMDRSLEYQQNVAGVGLGVVVLIAPSNRVEHVLPLAPGIRRALATLRPGQVTHVGAR